MFNILNKRFGKERTRRWCANFSTLCPRFPTESLTLWRGSPISLSEWILEIARRSRLAFELPF